MENEVINRRGLERARQTRRCRKVDRDRGAEAEGCTEEGSPPRLSLGIRQLESGNRLNGVVSPDSLGSSVAMTTITRAPSSPTSVEFLPPYPSDGSILPSCGQRHYDTWVHRQPWRPALALWDTDWRNRGPETKEGLARSPTVNPEKAKVELRVRVWSIKSGFLQGGLASGN